MKLSESFSTATPLGCIVRLGGPTVLFDAGKSALRSVGPTLERWRFFGEDNRVYRCEVRLVEAGGLSAYVPSLPGVASMGDTEEEALRNVQEALAGAITTYLSLNEPIPWCKQTEAPRPGELRRWVVVHG